MRTLVLEPSAIDYDRTHNAKSLVGHTAAFQKQGIPVIWVTNKKSVLTWPDTGNYRKFHYTIYDDVRKGRTGILRKIFIVYYKWLVRSSKHSITEVFEAEKIGGEDHVFVPTADWLLVQALLQILQERKNRNIPFIHLLVMYEQGDWMTGGYPYKKLLARIRNSGLLRSRIFIYTETKKHAQAMQDWLGVEIDSYPFPSTPIFREQRKQEVGKIRICALGGGRRDKGYHLLPQIIERYNLAKKKVDRAEFVIQRPRKRDKLKVAESTLESIRNVVLMDNQLSTEDYEDCLMSCDLMIFPYDRFVYYTRGSGLINEAVANAKPILCTRNSSLEEQIVCKNGLTADDPDEFAEGILEIESNLNVFKKRAKRAANIFLENYKNNAVLERIRNLNSQQSTID